MNSYKLNGTQLKLRRVPGYLLQLMRDSRPDIPIPTYSTKTVTGEVQVFVMDALYVQAHPECQEEWDAYLVAKKAEDTEFAEGFFKMLIGEGIEPFDVPEVWIAKLRRYKLNVPEDPEELRYQYVLAQLEGEQETLELVKAILKESKLDPEVVDRLKASFRSNQSRSAPKRSRQRVQPVEG